MTETIFTKIIAGEVPCHRIYEDTEVLAFLDIAPLAPGHTLVIPKEPAETLDQLSENSAAALGRALPRICRAIQHVIGCQAYNVLQNNGTIAHQEVRHVHFHIIPKPNEKQGLSVGWPAAPLDNDEAQQLAGKLAAAFTQSK